ncbi:hypothetical protein [Candidatus Darwinibacter acetoxidans]
MKRLRGYTRMSWERQIDGIEISLWVTPGWKYAYLYENGTRHVAKDAEEQAEIHRTLGLPEVGGDFETGLRQQVAGVGQPAPGGGINP